MQDEPDRWNDLLEWLYATPKEAMSAHMKAARQLTLFHGEVCSGGLYDNLAHLEDEYPHIELVWCYERICGNLAAGLIKEGLELLKRQDPADGLPDDARDAFFVAVDSVSRGHSLEVAIEAIESVFPGRPRSLRVLAYETAVAQARHFVPWSTLDSRYLDIGDDKVFGQVAKYAEEFSNEWSPGSH